MKVFTLALFLVLLTNNSCQKESVLYKSYGVITGQDYRMCACCGGWFLETGGEIFLFDSIPADSGFELAKETLPLKVRLDWQPVTGSCPANRITIIRIKKE